MYFRRTTLCVMCDLYAWCVRFANKRDRETRVYTLFAIRSFPVNKFSVHFQKSASANFSFGDARSSASRRDCTHHNARITLCAHRSESTSIHYAQFINFDVFTHNSRASHIVYSRLYSIKSYYASNFHSTVCLNLILHVCVLVFHNILYHMTWNFYCVSSNSNLSSPVNLVSFCSFVAAYKFRETYFWDDPHSFPGV